MEKREEDKPPFNERAALEELERFQSDIERYRQQRKSVGDEFDAFVKTLKSKTVEPPAAASPASRPDARLSVPAVQTPLAGPITAIPTPPVAPPSVEPAAPPTADRASRSRMPVLVVLLLLVAAVAAWMFWPRAAEEPAAPQSTSAPAPTTPPPAATSAPAAEPAPPPATPAAPPPDETVLTTTQHVWLRVTSDGKLIREGEFPAGTRIPLTPGNTLVIRTGNAGAVSLVLRGKDLGPLGAEGRVVTRTFTIER